MSWKEVFKKFCKDVGSCIIIGIVFSVIYYPIHGFISGDWNLK